MFQVLVKKGGLKQAENEIIVELISFSKYLQSLLLIETPWLVATVVSTGKTHELHIEAEYAVCTLWVNHHLVVSRSLAT